jgi:hypothetical protein
MADRDDSPYVYDKLFIQELIVGLLMWTAVARVGFRRLEEF